mgnify:CR=1 FL=1
MPFLQHGRRVRDPRAIHGAENLLQLEQRDMPSS